MDFWVEVSKPVKRMCLLNDRTPVACMFHTRVACRVQVGVMKLSIRWLAIDSFDNKIFTEKADVWSWGITMWEVRRFLCYRVFIILAAMR